MLKQVKFIVLSSIFLIVSQCVNGQTEELKTYINPVIPGDHPDPTLTQIGNDFYTTGSSFNPTPKIYHSTDLVHWEVIAPTSICVMEQLWKYSWRWYLGRPHGIL